LEGIRQKPEFAMSPWLPGRCRNEILLFVGGDGGVFLELPCGPT